jgi:O-antigen ligase
MPLGRVSLAALLTVGAAAILLVATIVVGQVSATGFVVLGVAFVLLLAAAAWRWPRVVLMAVVLSPIPDRYIVTGLVPASLGFVAHITSEALLAGVAIVIGVRGWREHTLVPALRHPTVGALVAFAALAAVSALVNLVPPTVALAGLAFTLDASVLFVAVRVVGYDLSQGLASVAAFIALVAVAAMVALAQALLDPNLFGLSALQGRYGEVYRLSAFLGDPNVFGAFIIAAVPFAIFGMVEAMLRRWRLVAMGLAMLLLIALWISFSRGAWLAFFVGAGTAIALINIRALFAGAALTALSFAIALNMPRDLLVAPPSPGASPPPRPDLIDSTLGRVDTVSQGKDLRTLFILNAMPIIRDHPLLGVGPGRYGGSVADIFPTPVYATYGTNKLFSNPLQRTVDNFWLHILVESGVLGFVAFLAALAVVGVPAIMSARSAVGRRRVLIGGIAGACAALIVSSVSTMMLEGNSVAYVFWFLLGVASLMTAKADRRVVAAADAVGDS